MPDPMSITRDRGELINWLLENCPRPRIVRAMLKYPEQVEVLGAFSALGKKQQPGILVRVTTDRATWQVAVCPRLGQSHAVYILHEVPWKFWTGDIHALPVLQGDNPAEYKKKRDEACKQI